MEENREEGLSLKREGASKEERNIVNLRKRSETDKDLQKSHDEPLEYSQPEPFISEPVEEKRHGGDKVKTVNASSGILDKITEYGIYLLIFLMPLFISPLSTEAYEFNKTFLLCFGTVALFFVWILDCIFIKKKIQFSKSPLTIAFVAYLVVLFASSYYSVDSASSFLGYSGNFYGSFVSYLALFMFYMIFISVAAARGTERVISKSIGTLILSALTVSIVSLPYYFGYTYLPFFDGAFAGFNLVSGYYHVFAIYLLVMLFVVFYDLSSFGKQKPRRKALDILAAVAILVNLFLIDWPMIYLIIFVLSATLMIFSGSIKKESLSSRSEAMVLVMIIFSSVLFMSSVNLNGILSGSVSVESSSTVSSMVGSLLKVNIESRDGSLQNGFGATEAVSIAQESLKDRPILGSGLGTYSYDFFEHKSADFNYGDNWALWFSKAYNEMLEKVSTTGILGMLAYLFLVALAFSLFVKNVKSAKHSEFLFVAFLSLLVFQFLFLETTMLRFLFVLLLAIAAAFSSRDIDPAAKKMLAVINIDNKKMSGGIVSFAGVLVILACSTSLVLGIQIFKAEARYKAAISTTDIASLDSDSLAEIMTLNPYRGDYAAGLSNIYLSRAYLSASVQENDQAAADKLAFEVSNALKYTKKAVEISPSNLLLWENYSFIYKSLESIGMSDGNDLAIKGYERSLALYPNDPILRTELGSLYLEEYKVDSSDGDKKANLSAAKAQLERSQELKNNYLPTAIALASVYSYEADKDKALAQIDIAYRIGGFDIESAVKVGMMLYNLGEKDKAKEALVPVVSADSENADAHYILGTIYKEEKKYSDALTEFNLVAEGNPENENVSKLITELKGLIGGNGSSNNSSNNSGNNNDSDESEEDVFSRIDDED